MTRLVIEIVAAVALVAVSVGFTIGWFAWRMFR